MKNKILLATTLTFLVALTGCSGNQKVSGKKYKNKVEFAAFSEKLTEIQTGPTLEGLDFTLNAKVHGVMSESLKRDNKDLTITSADYVQEFSNKYDTDNDTAIVEQKTTGKQTSTDKRGSEFVINLNANVKRTLQKETISEVESTVAIDTKDKKYYNKGSYALHKISELASSYAYYPAMSLFEAVEDYMSASEEEKAKYSFFIDKDLITVEYVSEVTSDIMKSEEKVGEEVYKIKNVSQIKYETKDDKISKVFGYLYSDNSMKQTYTAAKDNYLPGDVREASEVAAVSCELVAKKVEIARVDLSSYVLAPKDVEVEFGL